MASLLNVKAVQEGKRFLLAGFPHHHREEAARFARNLKRDNYEDIVIVDSETGQILYEDGEWKE